MNTVLQSFHKGRGSLPVSQTTTTTASSNSKSQPPAPAAEGVGGMRRRLSSLSLRIQPSMISTTTSAATSWAMRRSKSVSSMGESTGTSIRNWWEWGWNWILSRKPVFARDLELNQEETSILGCHNKGSWRHVFYKVRSEVRKLVGSDQVGLPQTVRYNSYNYSQNLDDNIRSRSSSYRG